jgi:hypothetical protein
MAEDAKVSQVSVLTSYAGSMMGFMESVSINLTAMNNLMVQKLDGLRKKLKYAEQIEAEAIADYNAIYDEYSKTDVNEMERKRMLLAKVEKLRERKKQAYRLREQIAIQVLVAQGATAVIIDNAKTFQSKVRDHVDKGLKVLKKSVTQLEQYNETKKKI